MKSKLKNISPFFSIVIPVYKTEQFLEQCLKSILYQSFTNFECIVINDGSPGIETLKFKLNQDKNWNHEFLPTNITLNRQCEFIFNKVVNNDNRFKLIEQKNAGASVARNYGLSSSIGSYIVFVDSDDWVEVNHLKNFFEQIEKHTVSSLISFAINKYYNTNISIPQFIPKHINLANAMHRLPFILWNVVWRKNIIDKYNIKLDERLGRGSKPSKRVTNAGEDSFFAFQYLECLIQEFGNFNTIWTENTYNYREVKKDIKYQEDINTLYNYSQFLADYCLKYSNLIIKITRIMLPHWASLANTKNNFLIIYRKFLTLLLRLISRCYF